MLFWRLVRIKQALLPLPALFSVLLCLQTFSACQYLVISFYSTPHLLQPAVKQKTTLQTSSVSQSGALFWKSSLVIPRFLCVSSQKPVFRRFSTSPSLLSLSLLGFSLSVCSTQLLPRLDMLLNLLPSFLSAFPPPLPSDLTVSVKSFSIKPYETFMLFSTSSFTLTSRVSHTDTELTKREEKKRLI